MVLSFLRRMVDQVDLLRSHCLELLDHIPDQVTFDGDYLYSAHFLFAETRGELYMLAADSLEAAKELCRGVDSMDLAVAHSRVQRPL